MDNNETVRKATKPLPGGSLVGQPTQPPSTDRTRWWDIAAKLRDKVDRASGSSHQAGRRISYNAYKRWRYASRASKASKRKATKASRKRNRGGHRR